MSKSLICAACLVLLKPIVYGLPTEEDFNDPNFYSGGCMIMPNSPDYICPSCGAEFDTQGVKVSDEQL